MAVDKKVPLQTSNNANVAAGAPPKAAAARSGKTIEEIYQKKSQLEHILLRPDTYIGSIEKHTATLWVYEDDHMVKREISYVPGLYKIFDEILVNAADNKQRDPSMNSVKVEINVEQQFISVYNNGNGVPVEIHQEEGIYVPEMIFGHLLTSSNYDDDEKKTTGGRNGYGAKLANIFSTEFVIETADGRRQKKYKQVFRDNMGKKSDPVITKCKESENWTKVTFKPDLAKFKMDLLEADVVALMKKRVVDIAGTLGKTVKVELNGVRLPVKDFTDYVDLYLKTASNFREAPIPRFFLKVNARWEICVSPSEGQFQQVSFVNGIATIKGGTHVDYVTNQISNHIATVVNKRKKNAIVKAHTVKNHLWVFVNSLIDNPAFDSQTKETLTTRQSSFGSKCELPPEFLKKVEKSEVVESLLSWAEFKLNKDLKKTDGSKKQRIIVPKLEDANEAGGKNSEKCTLILTEGDSAKSLAMAGIGVIGRDHYGVFPLRGKLLNVREASHEQIKKNAEIQYIKQILGLQQDKKYESVKSLRYGHLMIMTDQDHDGSHIKGLLINFIHSFWPSLLKIPSFLVEFITPIIKAHQDKKELAFYSMPEYESWRESLEASSGRWTIKYYKGLGTSTSKEGREYFSDLNKHKKDFQWEDEQDGDAIELAFSKKKIEARKNWLRQFEPGTYLDQKQALIKYSDFVNKELILFSMADLQRSIPSMVDGLKPGQRKILFCSFKKKLETETKVAQFSGYVSEKSAYHHGEASLASTIVNMAQDFVGSNNINLLQPNGQFGTRVNGGKDHASARYIFTKLSPITRFLFPKGDDRVLDYLNEDGQSIEPTWYVPVIPTVLVNGSEGIGTGWSSYIPNYNPRDIVANLRRLLNGEPMIPMDPWYKGFRGTIEKSATKESGASYTVSGIIEEIDETTLRITELPVRRWTESYNEFLMTFLIGNDPLLKDLNNQSDDTTVHFELTFSEEKLAKAKQEGLLKIFKLTSTISTSNMHLFDANGGIKKYDTPEQIIEDFCHVRLALYEKRKKALTEDLELELLRLDNQVRFILAVVNGDIIVSKRKQDDLVAELRDKGFTPYPKKVKAAVVAGADDTEETGENSETVDSKGAETGDYGYLLTMSIGTLTIEKVEALCKRKDKLIGDVDELRKSTAKSLWFKDLAALDIQLDDLDKRDEQDKIDRKSTKSKVLKKAGLKASKAAPKNPRKNTKKVPKEEPVPEAMEISNSSAMETDNAPEVVSKPKGKAAAKKAPARKPKAAARGLKDEDDDEEEVEVLSLKERLAAQNMSATSLIDEDEDAEVPALTARLAAHNIDSSPEQSEAMETEGAGRRRPTTSRAAAAKKKPVALTEISDDDDEDDDVEFDDEDKSDDDFGVEVLEAPAAKKKGGRKPAAAAAAKPPPAPAAKPPAAATKKRGPAAKKTTTSQVGQRLITEVLKPAENAIGISPEKKVRKMRASPFNKKSGSVLGKDGGKAVDVMAALDEENLESQESSAEVAVAPRARPARNRGKAKYVEEDEDEEDVVSEDSDFEEDVSEDSDFEAK